MARYSVLIQPSAAKELGKLPLEQRRRIVAKIGSLADNARPHGCEKLVENELYRIRQGDYRIVYSIHDEVLTVLVVRVGHRRDVYR